MVKGLETFREFFRNYQDQYVLIGGAACDMIFEEADIPFRATRDLDIVLVVEALTAEFGTRFWEFIHDGGYENRAKSNGSPQFYRFSNPKSEEYPFMLELFAKSESIFSNTTQVYRPLSLGDEISSLSAILLNDDYYQLIYTGRIIIDDVPMLSHMHLVLFKAKAWLDLTERKALGQQVKSKDIRKHMNDVARLAVLFTGDETCEVPASVLDDLRQFIEALKLNPPDMRNLGIAGISSEDIVAILNSVYVASLIEHG